MIGSSSMISKLLAGGGALALGLALHAAPAAQAQNAPAEATTTTLSLPPPMAAVPLPPPPPFPAADDSSTTGSVMPVAPNGNGLRFNFRGASLDTVLDYLGKAAGFIIVREATVEGRIDVVSHQPLNREQAVELLNTVLNQKGFAAIRSENTLRIVTLEEARKRDIPVRVGRDAEQIAKTDAMITQVVPVRYVQADQLIKNLEGLLPAYATISANEGSNAVVLTATQTDIRRMVQIIEALDTSVADISSIRVFKLNNGDATEIAKLLTDLFRPANQATTGNQGGNRGGFPMPPFFGRGRGDNEEAENRGDQARKAAIQVTAVADSRTNSVVVGAPEDVMPMIARLVEEIDTTTVEVREIRVFPLRYADAQTIADLVNDVYETEQTNTAASTAQSGFGRRFMFGGPMGGPPGMGGAANANSGTKADDEVQAVADIRTNSVVINADKGLMTQIGQMIAQLDTGNAKEKKVHVYPLKFADPEQTAIILNDMFGDTSRSSSISGSGSQRSSVFSEENTNSSSGSSSRSNSRGSGGSVPSGLGMN